MEEKLEKQQPERLKSLDALRGFDMFWIIARIANRCPRIAMVG